MKKMFAVSAMLTVLSAALSAQVKEGITIGAWGQAIVAPVVVTLDQPDDKGGGDTDVYTGVGAGFQGRPRFRVDVNGASPEGKYGFTLRISTNDLGTIGIQDYARVWAAPIPQIRIDAGRFREDVLMGKIIDNDSYRYVLSMEAGNSIFSRFDTGADGGALLSIKPVTGLFIGALAKLGPTAASWANGDKPANNAEFWYKNSQVAVGYTIPDVGLVRAQFFGADHSYTAGTANRIEAAFAFTGVEGLTVDLGFRYPVQIKPDDKHIRQLPLHAALGTKFVAGDFDITGRVDADFAGTKTDDNGTIKTETADAAKINIHLLPRYNLGFATLGLELGFIINGDKKVTTNNSGTKTEVTTEGGFQFGAGLWLFKSWGNGTAQVGVSFQPNSEPTKGTYQQGFIAVPLIFTYTF
jgi:hypothetical protein